MAQNSSKRSIYVYANWQGMQNPRLIGILHSERLKGREIFSFEYNGEWLKKGLSHMLDPDLQYYQGLHFNDSEKENFGMFLDSSPDRWGRILMRRREAVMARMEGRPEEKLFETDYLLGVFDEHRMGALRFKTDETGLFLNNNRQFSTPPWSSLRELEQISLKLEEDDVIDDPDYFKWLSMLIAPGASLGGARPKAGIIDDAGNLWIAKFPSLSDKGDVGGWEMVTYELATASGIRMSECRAQKFSSPYYTFLSKRFDRTDKGERIHFASAMTMLGYNDGYDFEDGASYLEIVEFIQNKGAYIKQDLNELWRRIVFNICVSNTDDHLRNHGFILTEKGWILSPAYDINPVETGMGLTLNVTENDNALDLDLAMEVYEYFRLSKQEAEQIISQVKSSVKRWRNIATKYGISRAEQELKALAFKQGEI